MQANDTLAVTQRKVCMLGAFGVGKTSLLEAVYVLATTRSFRTPRIADCCRHGASQYQLGGETDTDRRARLDLDWQAGQRQRAVNGRRTGLAEHLAVLPIVDPPVPPSTVAVTVNVSLAALAIVPMSQIPVPLV